MGVLYVVTDPEQTVFNPLITGAGEALIVTEGATDTVFEQPEAVTVSVTERVPGPAAPQHQQIPGLTGRGLQSPRQPLQ